MGCLKHIIEGDGNENLLAGVSQVSEAKLQEVLEGPLRPTGIKLRLTALSPEKQVFLKDTIRQFEVKEEGQAWTNGRLWHAIPPLKMNYSMHSTFEEAAAYVSFY